MKVSYKNLQDIAYRQQVEQIIAQLQLSDPTFTVYTSGSTGSPQKITLQKKHMFASARTTLRYLNLPTSCKALHCLPADKIGGIMMIVRAMLGQWELVVTQPSAEPLQGLPEDFDFAAMVPLQVSRSLAELNRCREIIIGGGHLSAGLQNKLRGHPARCWHTFGMTETISHVAMRQINPRQEEVFEALPEVSFASDENKRLIINAPHIGVAQMLTNDAVKLIDKQHFIWLGRFDNVVNSAGIKLYPEKLEQQMNLSQNYFLAGLPDDELGERLVLFIESAKKLPDAELRAALGNLNRHQQPKEVRYMPHFEYTSNGKLQRGLSAEYWTKNN